MSVSRAAVNKALFVGLGLGATMITGALSYVFYKYLRRDVMPLKWRRVGTLQQINLFPIKSCAPLELNPEEELICEVLGLRYHGIRDRSLMLVNNKHEIVTARAYPKLVLIRTKLVGETKLILSAEGMVPLELDIATLTKETPEKCIKTSVFGSKVDGMICGEKYDKWFSNFILGKNKGFHLIYYNHPKPIRPIDAGMKKEPFIMQADTGTFGDATSYNLMNLSSVDDLNTRLDQPVNALQFRGNFELKMDTPEPYAEDNWQWIRIGETAVFRKVAPCKRCILPNINAETGKRDKNGHPLKKLKTYRLINDKTSPTLGIHMGLRQAGVIKLNDIIYVEDNCQKKNNN